MLTGIPVMSILYLVACCSDVRMNHCPFPPSVRLMHLPLGADASPLEAPMKMTHRTSLLLPLLLAYVLQSELTSSLMCSTALLPLFSFLQEHNFICLMMWMFIIASGQTLPNFLILLLINLVTRCQNQILISIVME